MLKSIGQPMIKIRHSKVTDDYLATEEIKNQNWQYFIERVIEVCKYDKKNLKTFCLLRLRMWLWQKNLMKSFIIKFKEISIRQCNSYLLMNKITFVMTF